MTTTKVAIYVEVRDELALYTAALVRAKDDGLEAAHAVKMLRPDGEIDVNACLIMLFDPSTSPDGCKILESCVED